MVTVVSPKKWSSSLLLFVSVAKRMAEEALAKMNRPTMATDNSELYSVRMIFTRAATKVNVEMVLQVNPTIWSMQRGLLYI